MTNTKGHQAFDSKTALDTAVIRSIERLIKDEVKRVTAPTTARQEGA